MQNLFLFFLYFLFDMKLVIQIKEALTQVHVHFYFILEIILLILHEYILYKTFQLDILYSE